MSEYGTTARLKFFDFTNGWGYLTPADPRIKDIYLHVYVLREAGFAWIPKDMDLEVAYRIDAKGLVATKVLPHVRYRTARCESEEKLGVEREEAENRNRGSSSIHLEAARTQEMVLKERRNNTEPLRLRNENPNRCAVIEALAPNCNKERGR